MFFSRLLVGKMQKRVKRSNKRTQRRRRSMRGGWQNLNPAPVNDFSMDHSKNLSSMQGKEYDSLHVGQHGGGYAPNMGGAPVGTTGVMDDPALRGAARLNLLDGELHAIRGMSDQAGGSRRRSRRHSKKHGGSRRRSKKHGGSRRHSKKHGGSRRRSKKHGGSRRYRRHSGGAMPSLIPASADAQGMLIDPKVTSQGMNPEWQLAQDPKAFIPDAVRQSVGGV